MYKVRDEFARTTFKHKFADYEKARQYLRKLVRLECNSRRNRQPDFPMNYFGYKIIKVA